ncbi:hypothetical protein TWF694_002835 [Orbilia ellipsospora]|uniref:Uncharacterized protein n=1 Tax=Orbilia ellipsospora TaxID=2528407 RepID=A0AAV9WZW8_9PEZI
MHSKLSLPLLVTLSSIYHGAASLSASSSIIDFQNLMLPERKSIVHLDDLGGVIFQNFDVTHITHDANESTDDLPSPLSLGGIFGPKKDKSTVAIIKQNSQRGTITVPVGKRLKSLEFFCCSNAEGESILEGNPCKQTKCKATASSFHLTDGKRVRQTEGIAIADPARALTGTAPGAITSTTLPLVGFAGASAMGMARSIVIDFTSIDTKGPPAAGRRRRAIHNGAHTAKHATRDIMVVTSLFMEPVEDDS